MSRTSVPAMVDWYVNVTNMLHSCIDLLQQATCDSVEEANSRALAIEQMQMWLACTNRGKNTEHLPPVLYLSPPNYAPTSHFTAAILGFWVDVLQGAQKDLERDHLRDVESNVHRLRWLMDHIG